MLIRTYRDNTYAWHVDSVGNAWSIDLVSVTAAAVLASGFACALAAKFF
jgi:hypothetical protein